MGNINGETEMVREKFLAVKNIVAKIKDAFGRLMNTFL